jgi:hypothetical protein
MTPTKPLKIKDSTLQELTKIKETFTSAKGKEATYDEVILELIKAWQTKKRKDEPEHIGSTQTFY